MATDPAPGEFEILVISLEGLVDSGLPIAASRAGAVGLLNLSSWRPAPGPLAEVGRLARLARGRYGAVLPRRSHAPGRDVLEALRGSDLILVPAEGDATAEAVAGARGLGRRVGLVVTSEADARLGEALGVDLLVARGNEAGGEVGEETTFILVQRLRASSRLPLYAWGGIGPCTGAACRVAGLAGVAVDWQLGLTRESPLGEELRRRFARFDGSETQVAAGPRGRLYRCYAPPGSAARELLASLAEAAGPGGVVDDEEWDRTVSALVADPDPGSASRAWAAGQDAAAAAGWAERGPGVARVLDWLRGEIERNARGAADSRPLARGGPLARAHGTEYPLVQGPMTRVSDVPEFCRAVADGGGLPFLALALMAEGPVRDLMGRTRDLMGGKPWGVGILGFVEPAVRDRQVAVIREVRPPFAIIAGGRPDQAAALEDAGVFTYLHVPSPLMLDSFLKDGARHFIFEGRECGGHVGPRSSFVLWEGMIRMLLDAALPAAEAEKVHVLFAGGVHDAASGAMVSALAEPLVRRGMKVGALLGTAYLFTEEIVGTGAVVAGFQDVALGAEGTALVEYGPGHSVRCAPTEFVRTFEDARRTLRDRSRPAEEVRDELERLSLGRLRIASKGLTRAAEDRDGAALDELDSYRQRREGMYMIGQVAALRRERCTVRGLHAHVCDGSAALLDAANNRPPAEPPVVEPPAPAPFDVAIVGMSCLLPGAGSVAEFWDNILARRDLVGDVPPERFDVGRWFDADPAARDRINSRWGGFLDPVAFRPTKFGIPPAALASIEPGQLLALELVDRALRDAGLAESNPHKARTSVIFGVSGGLAELGSKYVFRALLPQFLDNPDVSQWPELPEWTEDSFPGILPNMVSGRVSNRFDFGGPNYTIDAACASSLAAVAVACRELADGVSDVAVVGGCDTAQNAFGYLCFAKSGALSPTGRSRAFDAGADGISISEGLAAVILKRREDAERDGDRIYAVIRAVAGGSDGRSKGLTAPCADGQGRTLRRAYAQARFSPATLGLVEAHGTGTALGDATEGRALSDLLAEHGAGPESVALGSVKSMVGHTKASAGVVGLIKAALALHLRALPPTLHVEAPNPRAGLGGGPLYLNSEARPWVADGHPRRAGVSSFGFGGTNFHAVLEEYRDEARVTPRALPRQARPAELFVFRGNSAPDLSGRARRFAAEVRESIGRDGGPSLFDLAIELHQRGASANAPRAAAVVASSLPELAERLDALGALIDGRGRAQAGVYYEAEPLGAGSPLAVLFPGQGAQFPDMLRALAVEFPEVVEVFALADAALAGRHDRRLSAYVFPPPAADAAGRARAAELLKATDVAQPALGACGLALARLLEVFGVRPAMAGGHSYGELVALCVAGGLDESALAPLSLARAEAMLAAVRGREGDDPGRMRAVHADRAAVERAVAGCDGVWVANHNSPRQVVLSGTRPGMDRAASALEAAGLAGTDLAVACAFHSPLMAGARARFENDLNAVEFRAPRIAVFSNVSADRYPGDPATTRALLAEQLVSQVRFADQVEAMYAAGARVFVEAGPSRLLAGFVDQVLGERPHAAVSVQVQGREGVTQWLHALAALAAQGVPVSLDRLFEGRTAPAEPTRRVPGPVYLVDGADAWPADAPRPSPPPRPRLAVAPLPTSEPPAAIPVNGRSHHVAGQGTAAERVIIQSQASPPITQPLAPADRATAYAEFQGVMRHFLEVQHRVHAAYVRGTADGPALAERQAAPAAQPAPRTPVSAPVPEPKPVEVAPETQPGPKEEVSWAERLVTITSERTGYPPEMLDLDAHLEADLGIDSIKRVEIVGAFRRAVLPGLASPPPAFMEAISAARTLRAILDGVNGLLGSPEPLEPPPPTPVASPAGGVATVETAERFTGAVVAAPIGAHPGRPLAAGAVVVTDDGEGAARELAIAMASQDRPVVALDADDLADAGAAARALGRVREEHGAVAAVVHLLPLRGAPGFPGVGAGEWPRWADPEVKGLLFLLQAAAPELASARSGSFAVVGATRDGGDFGGPAGTEARCPWRGGVAGLLKTAAKEWPGARFRAVDVGEGPEAAAWLRELGEDGPVEVGYRRGARLTIRAARAELPPAAPARPAVSLSKESVVLVTGGARGITGEVAREVAGRTGARFVLLGRTPRPAEEPAETARWPEGVELRRAVRQQLGGAPAKEVEAHVRRLLREREVRRTLDDLRRAGSAVEYVACDVRRAGDVGAVVREVRDRFGGIDAVIHGAGVIEDHLIPDKTAVSFDRVVETKVNPVLALAEALDPDRLKLFVLFSSVAGFVGNPGQGDYAAANEVLNRMARRLRDLWPGKVVAMNWGPWSGAGMVKPEVADQFAARGIGLVTVAAGRRAVWQEIEHRGGGDVRVVIGSGPWGEEEPAAAAVTAEVAVAAVETSRTPVVLAGDCSCGAVDDCSCGPAGAFA